ncbi:hypothetical protein ONZ51_g5594 [Trametes cubensis]|uniref:Fungal-type protein kinase domain-containing protein n=1 Tax=Trametes cubensis TaxID=1111947 RepID=A0AAD7TTN5_9APHY|nr:hypothetical protein ONZ51_g5594 [Trametes cubensis]
MYPDSSSRIDSCPPTQEFVAMAGVYVGLIHAKSVNDILMVAYNVLEAHRKVLRAGVFYDFPIGFSASTILISSSSPAYPHVAEGCNLDGRPVGLFVDFDAPRGRNEAVGEVQAPLLTRVRTVKPIYAARAVVTGRDIPTPKTLLYKKMPTLSTKAKSLYIKLHGEPRYNRYCDDPRGNTYHGGIRPLYCDADDLADVAKALPRDHRPRYDAESIFWTLYATLLRVRPERGVETETSERALRRDWSILASHTVPGEARSPIYRDERNALLDCGRWIFVTPFLPEMQDVADLLLLMLKQVLPSYALMTTRPPFEDHLHEALQRLILEYVVAHEANPIPIIPGALRLVGTANDFC